MLLNKSEIDVNKAKTTTGKTPIFIATQKGHTQVVQILLNQKEIDVNKVTTDSRGETPLITAIRFWNYDIAELLLGHPSIDVNKKRTSDESSPLWVAVNEGDSAVGK